MASVDAPRTSTLNAQVTPAASAHPNSTETIARWLRKRERCHWAIGLDREGRSSGNDGLMVRLQTALIRSGLDAAVKKAAELPR